MKRLLCVFILLSVLFSCKRMPQMVVLDVKQIDKFPSGSALVYHSNYIWMAGDDAPVLWIMDNKMNKVDSIPLYSSSSFRMSHKIKADLEAGTAFKNKSQQGLLWLGSGSGPARNRGWVVDTEAKEKKEFLLDTFYSRLRGGGIKKLNIEGLAQMPGWMVLANRGSNYFPRNYLIFTSNDFWKNQDIAPIRLIAVGGNNSKFKFRSLSGLDYSYRSDMLLATLSTEDIKRDGRDGLIGKSFLWLFFDMNRKTKFSAVNPDRIYDLGQFDVRFSGAKIEAVTVVEDVKAFIECWLAAENDDGKTTLFKVRIFR